MTENTDIGSVKTGLKKIRLVYRTVQLRYRFWTALLASLGWALLWHVLDVTIILPAGIRTAAARISLLLLIAMLVYLIYLLLKPVSPKTIAAMIEARDPELHQELSTALQWEDEPGAIEGYSQDLLLALRGKMSGVLRRLDHEKMFPGPSARLKTAALSLAAVMSLSLIIWPGPGKLTWQRFYDPDGPCGDWHNIRVQPGSARLAEGESFLAELSLPGPGRRRPYLLIRGKQNRQRIGFRDQGGGRWQAQSEGVRESFEYRIVHGRSQSRIYEVQVYRPLTLSDLELEIIPPSYTGLRPYVQGNDGSITAPRGTRVNLTARASQPLRKAGIIQEDGPLTGAVATTESLLKTSLTVSRNSRYRLWAQGESGDTLLHSLEYVITVLEDARPTAEITAPADDWPLPEGLPADIQLRLTDDFGLSRAALHFKDPQSEKVYEIGLEPAVLDTQVSFTWNSSGSFLLPGDSVLYWAEAWDNDAVSGPKSARSKVRKFRVPTREELFRSAAQADSAYRQNLDQAQQQNRSVKQEMERLSQAVKENRKMDWQQKAAVEEALKKQEELVSRMEQAAEQARQDVKQQATGFKFDPQTVEKLAELKQLFDQVASEEMRQAMEEMRQALQNMDRKQIEQSLENLKLSQEEFQQRLDAAIASLKELQQEQMLSRLKQEVDRMAAEQKALKDSLANNPGKEVSNNLKQRQEQLAKDLETSLQQANELSQQMNDGNPQAAQKMQQSTQKARSQNTPQKMRQASQKMESGQNREARELQQDALTDLSELSAGLQSAKSAMGSQRSKAASQAMRQKAKELINLSRQQEQLNQRIQNGSSDPADLAWRQQVLQRQASRVKQKLDDLTRKSFLLSPQAGQSLQEAVKQMENSSQSLSQGRGQQAGASGKSAQGLLNRSAAALIQSSSQSGSSGSGDMMGDLEGMSGMQQNINQASQGLMPVPGGDPGGLSQSARSQMARLAAEQEAVRQGMEEFNQRYGGRPDLAGKLDDLVKEMQQVVEDMKRSQFDRQTQERQERILARMLSAGHSLKEQDSSPQRQAQPGQEDQKTNGPARPVQGDPAWNNLPDWRNQPYPLEYRELLEKYYRSLGQ